MSWKTLCAICGLSLLALPPVLADHHQQAEQAGGNEEMAAMMAAWQKAMTPGEPHGKLAKTAGSWTATTRMWMDPQGEPMVAEGTAEREMTHGGRVLVEHFESIMMGQPFTGTGRHGFDNVTGRYWSTWTDTMSTGLFVSYGSENEDGSITYHGEFEDPTTGNTTKARAVVRWKDEDTQLFEWYEDRGEGEVRTMEITYKRVRKE